ncbi:50S ribosomal protein L20 [Candidatus Babeliales bacterium]|nr:50S ribosomal protein L20 [Candidatus Babeliales bacterium]
MSRVKRGVVTKRRHKRLLKQTKGFWGQRSNIFKRAKETLMRAMAFAYKGRKLKKRNYRALFISRIAAACRQRGISYSRFIGGLIKKSILLNRKMLSQLAILEPTAFDTLVEMAKQ